MTGIDRSVTEKDAEIILGFSAEALEKYGSNILAEYKKALEMYGKALNLLINELEKVDGGLKVLEEKKDAILAAEHIGKDDLKIKELLGEMKGLNKELDRFYGYHKVTIGDVIPVSSGTLHALGPGVEVVEPQIAGPTQSLEDGATYPVRYYFPGYKREGAQKKLDLDRISEMTVSPVREAAPEIVKDAGGYKIERLSGGFEDKGLEVNRITLEKGTEMDFEGILSFHNLVSLEGEAGVITAGKEVDIPKAVPGGKMLIVPASAGEFKIKAHTKCLIIDTFSPV